MSPSERCRLRPQLPMIICLHQQALLEQIVNKVHHKQSVPLRAAVNHQSQDVHSRTPSQSLSQIGFNFHLGEQFQRQPLSLPTSN